MIQLYEMNITDFNTFKNKLFYILHSNMSKIALSIDIKSFPLFIKNFKVEKDSLTKLFHYSSSPNLKPLSGCDGSIYENYIGQYSENKIILLN